jgi:D-alanine-D-alanine ligase
MARTIVGILRGGSSSEYEHSLKSGAALLKALPEDRFDTRDIFVDRSGLWHARGMPASAARALSQIDVVYNALHGGAGEDGTVQRILQRSGIPYSGSNALAANMSMNKIAARSILQRAGVKVPMGMYFTVQDGTTAEMAMQAFAKFPPPYVVKPSMEGVSTGIIIAESLLALPDAIGDVLDEYGIALVEEFLLGTEASVGVIENFRNEPLYVLPPAEIILPEGARYLNNETISSGAHEYRVPSNFTYEEKQAITAMARAAHKALGLSHFSNADIMLTNHGPYLMEVNTSPHLHDKAPFHHMLESVGSSVKDFAEHAISMAEQH